MYKAERRKENFAIKARAEGACSLCRAAAKSRHYEVLPQLAIKARAEGACSLCRAAAKSRHYEVLPQSRKEKGERRKQKEVERLGRLGNLGKLESSINMCRRHLTFHFSPFTFHLSLFSVRRG